MDESNDLIYGLELQARALAPQYGENNEVCFFVATNSLKPTNQVHLVEYNEEEASLKSKIFEHNLGEVWKLNANPHDLYEIGTCFNQYTGNNIRSKIALLKYQENDCPDGIELKKELLSWHQVEVLPTTLFSNNAKTVEFHPSRREPLICVLGNKLVLFNRTESQTRQVATITPPPTGTSSKHTTHTVTGGKWSHHHQGQQFIALYDTHIRAYDIRDSQQCAWSIEDAHIFLVRDIDCNPNKQCHFVTGGDDGYVKVWDCRMPKEAIFSRNDHDHWIWCVRFNHFHDQLILSSSSDCKVLLTCAGSVSSENLEDLNASSVTSYDPVQNNRFLADGLLQTFSHHEDSVYCVEWSSADPWIFASLSYDGRLLISKVPKHHKYQIIL